MLSTQPTMIHRLVARTGLFARPLAHDALLVLFGSAVMILCAQVNFPQPVADMPPSAQTFGVLLIGALLGPRLGALAMVAYLLEGLIGLPVFALNRNAWSPSSIAVLPVVVGPTAGYLWAFPFAAALVGWLAQRGWDRRVGTALLMMAAGTGVIILYGVMYRVGLLSSLTGTSTSITTLLTTSVLPFLPGDIAKVALAAVVLPCGWRLLGTTSDE